VAASLVGLASVLIWIYLIAFRGGFWRLHPAAAAAGPVPARNVVAVVPARDEAALVGRSILSLLAQDCPGRLTIVLVDDHSTDGTAAAARAAAAAQGAPDRLIVLSARPVPEGWTGKLWAVREGIEAARPLAPDYLLLTDADIEHAPQNLRGLVRRAEAGRYDLTSLMVKLNCRSFWERLLIPAFTFFFFKLYPPRWVADPSRRTSAAAGGCVLLRPSALDRVGGVERIRGEIIDDCALARLVKPAGRVWLGFSDTARSLREYRSCRPIWRMIARTAFAELGYSAPALALTLSLLLFTYLAPPLLLLSGKPAAMLCGAAAWIAMAAAYMPLLRAHDAPPLLAVTLPAIALFYAAATIASAVLHWRGRGGYWKGRFQAAALR
jgi:hopene-associated glycosyltransferase HpnB